MSLTYKLKSKLLKYSFVVAISINLLTINSGILLLTLNNKAEAGGGSPPPPPPPPLPTNPTTTPIDPKSAAKDINAELGATFDPTNFFNSLKKKTKNQTNNHGPKLDARKEQNVLINLLSGDFYDPKKRFSVIKDVVENKNLSFHSKVDLLERINLAKGVYTKDTNGDIQVDPIFNSSSSNSTYISNFNPNYKYIILYSTPTEILEKDLTSEIIDITKDFEKDSKRNSYRNFDATKLKQIEQERVYSLIKSEAESLIKSAYGNNIEYIDYYNNNISDNSYEKYFTKYEKDVITKALGYKRAYEEKTGLYKSEVDKLDISTLNKEEYIKKCEEILEKIGESSWDSYQVSKPGSNSKINYEDYEKLVINEAKKRAVIARFLTEDNNKINGKRLKIVKEDGSAEYVDNTEFNLIMAENNWDLTPANIPLSQVMKDTNNLSENERIKELLARIEFLENNINNLDILNELEDAKRQLDELKSKKITGLFALNNNGENVSISFDQNLIDIFKILKEIPDFVNIIRKHPDLFPTIFNNPNFLAFLEKYSPEDYENIIIELSLLDSKSQSLESLIVKKQISEEVTLHNQVASITNKPIHMGIHGRLLLPNAAIAGGDEEDAINRGVWISSLYGASNQKAWRSIPKYKGRTSGVTIGMDTELSNSSDVIGMAYSRIESHFYNKKFAKVALNGHLFSIYGLKELPKNFSLQAIASVGHNYIKNKATTANNIISKYQNNNFNFEALLNYKYRTNCNLYLIPNIGLKYDYSRNSGYKGNNFVQKLMIQKKSNRLLTTSLGGKVEFKSIKVLNDITLVPSLYGNIENRFYNKDTKVNAKAILNNQIIKEKIILSKQPKFGYNIGGNVLLTKKNVNVIFEYNHYTHKKYKSHQGVVKLKVNL